VTLVMIRHAIAVPSGTPGIADDDRPLTQKGRRRFRQAARGLARITPRPAILLSSPLPRALETAGIAAKAWGRIRPRQEPALARGSVPRIVDVLAALPADVTVALVGHEPTLSMLLARLVGTPHAERLTFRKGGAALVELEGAPASGGRLVWYLRPRILRLIGRD
jgi:phosphohistidine phosphatase